MGIQGTYWCTKAVGCDVTQSAAYMPTCIESFWPVLLYLLCVIIKQWCVASGPQVHLLHDTTECPVELLSRLSVSSFSLLIGFVKDLIQSKKQTNHQYLERLKYEISLIIRTSLCNNLTKSICMKTIQLKFMKCKLLLQFTKIYDYINLSINNIINLSLYNKIIIHF